MTEFKSAWFVYCEAVQHFVDTPKLQEFDLMVDVILDEIWRRTEKSLRKKNKNGGKTSWEMN